MNEQNQAYTSSNQPLDSGLWSLLTVASIHSISGDPQQLVHEFGLPFDAQKILLAAQSLKMTAKVIKQDEDRLSKAPLPAVAKNKEGDFFILARLIVPVRPEEDTDPSVVDGEQNSLTSKVLIHKAGHAPSTITMEEFLSTWTGELIYFTSQASFASAMAQFDFTWFIPAIVKYRKLLGEILLISIVLQLIGLITPLFFQVIMDKVLVNHAMKTLNVIAIGLILSILFESVLTGIRTWIFALTSSKIDVELGARLFRHLLGLPTAYFQARRVGDSVARIRELENIRSFLTSNAMTLVIDIAFSFIFLAVMFWYSVDLTLLVICSIPIYILISFIFTPLIRKRLDIKFNKGAENQSFLVESITGIDTVKALAVEPRWIQTWDQQLASYVAASLSVNNVSNIASGGVSLIGKLVTALIMWIGATLVIDGKLTVGELIAFNMLAGQVSSPILRLAQLWNDFQQVGISMSRLGDILNSKVETFGQKTRLPRLEGQISFDNVSFRYRPDASDVLQQINFIVAPGEIIGIVGRSGSGKSTLTKLVQRLYVPDRGRVLVDGQDIAIIDTTSLRQQIGVVLQENVLFNRSVRSNIALTNPSYPIEVVTAAAKLAGAHDFICELPEGYDTMVGEQGAGLSGGQRQRIAIARALISNPRVLIFDEATSALDYESEKIIQDNMRDICKGRTVLIIAHRLTAVREANRILVMDRGQIVQIGSHDQLLQDRSGVYARLYRLQQGDKADLDDFSPHGRH